MSSHRMLPPGCTIGEMSNDHDARDVGDANPSAERVKATLNQVATALRQFWEGYLQSPSSG